MPRTTLVMKRDATPEIPGLEVVRMLGRGATSEVFEARDPRFGTRFVVKRLRPQLKGVVDLIRFVREAEVLRRLKHPHIVPVLHFERDADPPYYVMPFREGRPVSALVADGPADPIQVARIARDACCGLAEAHRLKIVHRDVKPANLFLEANGRTVLLDFGLVKAVDATDGITKAGVILGTPATMSPEQCRAETVTPRSDVYSLGVTVMELVLGKNPFLANDLPTTIWRHMNDMPRRLDALLPNKVSEELGELVHRMIAKDPKNRPTSESCLETFAGIVRTHERGFRPSRKHGRPRSRRY